MIFLVAWENIGAMGRMSSVQRDINFFIGHFLNHQAVEYRNYMISVMAREVMYSRKLYRLLVGAKDYQAELRKKKHRPKKLRRLLLEQHLRFHLSRLFAEKRRNDKKNRKQLLHVLATGRLRHYLFKSQKLRKLGPIGSVRRRYPKLFKKHMRQYSRELSQMPKCKQRKADATARRKEIWKNRLSRLVKHKKEKKEVMDKDALRRNARNYLNRAYETVFSKVRVAARNGHYPWVEAPVPVELERTFTGHRGWWQEIGIEFGHIAYDAAPLFRTDL